ncbi:hypothetical protein GCM10010517_59660 [Streptosporangium fragile]|uniref:Uncharacterized protein n=1 Tax=Streptosporangium fragile TaxID=46186 RepID=A0ABP6ILC2_9ACTN
MYLIHARLRAPEIDGHPVSPEERTSAREIRRLLTVLAEPEDRLEHAYSEARPDGVALGLFFRQPTLDVAESAADRLCRRCLDTVPGLAGWSLAGCGADLTLALAPLGTLGGQAWQRPAIAAR